METHLLWKNHANSAEEVATTKGNMAFHVIDPGEALTDESEDATWTSHGSKGSPRIPNQSMHRGWIRGPTGQPPRGTTPRKEGRRGRPILGSVKPPLPPFIVSLHVVAPHWSLAASRGVLEHSEPPSKHGPCL